MMKIRLALIGALVGMPVLAFADGATISSGARLAATCVACHGTNGATQGSTLPKLAGQPREALLASLRAFKAGSREATIMTQIAKGYTDEQLEVLATYFASQRKEQP